jgi:hypothetical protein
LTSISALGMACCMKSAQRREGESATSDDDAKPQPASARHPPIAVTVLDIMCDLASGRESRCKKERSISDIVRDAVE